MDPDIAALERAIREHDAVLAARGPVVWVGSEPTFTDRYSEAPEWLTEALGGDKQRRARRILTRLRETQPGALVLRSLGRQYPGEALPRWSLGLYARRDGVTVWDGPPDPLTEPGDCDRQQLTRLWSALVDALKARGWPAAGFRVEAEFELRVLFRLDGSPPQADPAQNPRLMRPSPHRQPIPAAGLVDELAADGDYLVALGCVPLEAEGGAQACVELPAFAQVGDFLEFVNCLSRAAHQAGLTALVWRGFPPPVDQSVAWTTLTPDPAVLEINQAPADSVEAFLAVNRVLHAEAGADGLSPYRLQYNGLVSDSGGGGQFTLGGPSPEQSPFFVAPWLLPRLIRYLNAHPALSYWFAPANVGSHSQSPRPDEAVRESFSELAVALEQLERSAAPQPEFIWQSLRPFLVDPSGNTHRSELNIEKLWNPYLSGRGCLGLVEFRAFRMARSPESAAAIAALLRAIAAMLVEEDRAPDLVEWGATLHDRFALPFYLQQDLSAVLLDLEACGLGLGEPLATRLRRDPERIIWTAEFGGCVLEVQQALEFWPLLDDAASQEGGSRLVDSSTARLQVSLRPVSGDAADLQDWRLVVGRYRVPLRSEQDADGPLSLFGLRYRSFVPWRGLHPGIPAQGPIGLTLQHPRVPGCLRVTLHEWRPDPRPYEGLPASLQEAAERRSERFVVEPSEDGEPPSSEPPPARALSDCCLDLRRL